MDKTYMEIKLFWLTKELSCNTPNAGVRVILLSYVFRSSETRISIRRPPNMNESSVLTGRCRNGTERTFKLRSQHSSCRDSFNTEAVLVYDKAPAPVAVMRPEIKDTLCTLELVTTISFELSTHNNQPINVIKHTRCPVSGHKLFDVLSLQRQD